MPFKQLDGDEVSVEVPAETLAALGTAVVAIGISFWWSGSPPEEQQSAVSVPVQGGGTPGNAGVLPAAEPPALHLAERWDNFRALCRVTLGETKADALPDLPPLTAEQRRPVQHRFFRSAAPVTPRTERAGR